MSAQAAILRQNPAPTRRPDRDSVTMSTVALRACRMCLLVLAYDNDERHRFVFAGNRDEYHARPAHEAKWWADAPTVLAGRDLEAGGTWLGITRSGRFAAVTNYRELRNDDGTREKRSRGEIVSEFLKGTVTAEAFVTRLHAVGTRYRGFCLIAGDQSSLWFVSNRDGEPRPLEQGIFGLSNQLLDVPWPKVVRAKAQLEHTLARGASTSALLDMLAERAPAQSATPLDLESGFEHAAASIFVSAPHYGTRCSTAITITRAGDVEFVERSFDSRGAPTGEQRFEFRIEQATQ